MKLLNKMFKECQTHTWQPSTNHGKSQSTTRPRSILKNNIRGANANDCKSIDGLPVTTKNDNPSTKLNDVSTKMSKTSLEQCFFEVGSLSTNDIAT